MAQIIKNRRGSLDRLSANTGSLQKGEILIATGSSKLSNVTNGQGLVFAVVESGSVVAANRILQGNTPQIFSASQYGHLLDGVPFYASSSKTLYLLNADGNNAIDLSGNISDFSSSVSSSLANLSSSVASVTGDFSSSVATSFSASAYNLNAVSAAFHHDIFDFGGLSASIAVDFSASAASVNNLSYSVDSRLDTIETSIGSGGSLGTRVSDLEALTGSYATTGSNTFTDGQTIQGNIVIESNGQIRIESNTADTLFGMYDGNSILGAYYQMWGNNHASATQRGSAEFVYDNRNGGESGFNIASFNGSTWVRKFRVDDNGAQVTGSLEVTNGITGSLFGTSSWALNTLSAFTASNIEGGATNYIPVFNTPTSLTSSVIYQSGSHVAINQTAFTSGDPEALYVFQTHPTSFNVITGRGNSNNYLQLNIQIGRAHV